MTAYSYDPETVRGVPLRSAQLKHRPTDWDRVKEEGGGGSVEVDIADRVKSAQDVNFRRLQCSITEMDADIAAQGAVLRALDNCDGGTGGGGGGFDGDGKQSGDGAAEICKQDAKLLIHRNRLDSMLFKARHCLP